jgi:polymorphic membrane protein
MLNGGRVRAVLGMALGVAVCGATACQASAASPAGGPQTALPAQAVAPAAPPAATSAPDRSRTLAAMSAVTASSQLPQRGNPDGHAWVPLAGRAVSTARPDHVIGLGTPASCTSADVVKAVAMGGIITFNCGRAPVTITMTATAKIVAGSQIVIDGGGRVTLSGGGKIRILDMDTCPDCWEQTGPQLIVQNMRFADGYSGARQTRASADYGGGAIFDRGGQLKVVNSEFIGNRCYQYGPDLGGGAIRAYGMDMSTPIYLTHDTFLDNSCSNGGALDGLYANFDVINSLLTGNTAIGWGQNPALPGTPGGGSGGAIYTDGKSYSLNIDGTAISANSAREGGGGVFCVIDKGNGSLTFKYSHLSHNLSGQFQDAPGIFYHRDGHDVQPAVIDSTIR